MTGLAEKRVLIVEDEYFVAADLARFFSELGAVVLGPVPTVAEAYALAELADAAVLDINLHGESVFPIADRLVARSIPFVFFTGYENSIVPARLRHISNLAKPSSQRMIVEALFQPDLGDQRGSVDDIIGLLPKLRLAARMLLADDKAADRLVEKVLKDAIRLMADRVDGETTDVWLYGLLRRAAVAARGFLN